MDKGLVFMTFSLLCGWLILDDFYGHGYVRNFANNLSSMNPLSPIQNVISNQANKVTGFDPTSTIVKDINNRIKNHQPLTDAENKYMLSHTLQQ